MELFSGMLGHILVAGGGAALVEIVKRSHLYFKEKRPLAAFYSFNDNKPIIISLSEIEIATDGEFFRRASPIDGVQGTDQITDYLRVLGYKKNQYDIRFGSEMHNDLYRNNLILIGGYENNRASQQLRETFLDRRSFAWSDNVIHEVGNQSSPRSWAIHAPKGQIEVDYCLISRLQNPFIRNGDPGTLLVAFEGVRHFGTIGGIEFCNRDLIRILKEKGVRRFDASVSIEIVISINVKYLKEGYRLEYGDIESLYIDRKRRL